MLALRLHTHAPIEDMPLKSFEQELPEARPGELLIKVQACGICHTDLHIIEGDIHPPHLPIIPGHQIVGTVEVIGADVEGWLPGDRAGVPWLHGACKACDHCRRGDENLCPEATFTGFDHDGGYAGWVMADAAYVLKIPAAFSPEQAAPLLCAGIIGYRSLKRADLQSGERLGLFGFGASAHLAIQVSNFWNCEAYVFTRSIEHRRLAMELGAFWVGGAEDKPPHKLDRAVLFAPAGELVPVILARLRRGGTLAINAIHLSPIPALQYDLLYGERTLRSVSNATFQDGEDFMSLASSIPLRVSTVAYPLEEANQALADLKHSRISGAGVLLT